VPLQLVVMLGDGGEVEMDGTAFFPLVSGSK
jgi:hypothetical protein